MLVAAIGYSGASNTQYNAALPVHPKHLLAQAAEAEAEAAVNGENVVVMGVVVTQAKFVVVKVAVPALVVQEIVLLATVTVVVMTVVPLLLNIVVVVLVVRLANRVAVVCVVMAVHVASGMVT